jgi:glucose-1-phosphate thymidylyltransferase
VTGRVRLGSQSRVVNSIIRGPVVIGEGAEIIDSFIGPYTTIVSRTRIIHSVVEHSVILNDCRIEHISRLEDSLIGRESRIF